jgi:uncharacterized protein DUF1876
MSTHSTHTIWAIEVVIDEDSSATEAKATLQVGDRRLTGWGRARRNPHDPERPRVGEALACARALSELSHKLLDAAAGEIEEFEGRRVELQS